MKNTLLTYICITFLLSSCFKLHFSPEISYTAENETIWFDTCKNDEIVEYNITMNSDFDNNYFLKEFSIFEGTNELEKIIFDKKTKTYNYNYHYFISESNLYEREINLIFQVTDNKDWTTKKDATIKIFEIFHEGFIQFYSSNLTFNNLNINDWNSSTPFINLYYDYSYISNPTNEISEIIIAFAYDENLGFVLASPDALWYKQKVNENINANWNIEDKNHTKLEKIIFLTWDDFNDEYLDALNISNSYINDLEANGVGAANLQPDDLIGFETYLGQKGIIKVNDISIENRSLTFEMKYLTIPSCKKENL